MSDPLLSTDGMVVIHDGCMSRIDKVARVAAQVPTRSWLRVFWERPNASKNCCRCYNCLLTMSSLEIAGARSAGRSDLAEDLESAWRSSRRALAVSKVRRRLRSLPGALVKRLGLGTKKPLRHAE